MFCRYGDRRTFCNDTGIYYTSMEEKAIISLIIQGFFVVYPYRRKSSRFFSALFMVSCFHAIPLPAGEKKERTIRMFSNCLAVGAGGFAGAVGRYLIGLIPILHRGAFPLHTLLINIVGAVLIGAVTKSAQNVPGLSPNLLLFLKVGVCGGFTTFSTFSLESLTLLESGKITLFFLYAGLSLVLCIAGVALGRALV